MKILVCEVCGKNIQQVYVMRVAVGKDNLKYLCVDCFWNQPKIWNPPPSKTEGRLLCK